MMVKISALFDEKLAFDTESYIQGYIPAGEYAFVKFSGSGSYYCEKDGTGNIVDNDNFNGKASINLSNGQYLKLSRAIISKAE